MYYFFEEQNKEKLLVFQIGLDEFYRLNRSIGCRMTLHIVK